MSTAKELRESKGLSQSELSNISGLSTATISRLENGGEVLKSTVMALCAALGTSVHSITDVNIVNRVARRSREK